MMEQVTICGVPHKIKYCEDSFNVDTSHLTDSVTMLTKEGFELRHEVFLHEAPTEPEEVSEE